MTHKSMLLKSKDKETQGSLTAAVTALLAQVNVLCASRPRSAADFGLLIPLRRHSELHFTNEELRHRQREDSLL